MTTETTNQGSGGVERKVIPMAKKPPLRRDYSIAGPLPFLRKVRDGRF